MVEKEIEKHIINTSEKDTVSSGSIKKEYQWGYKGNSKKTSHNLPKSVYQPLSGLVPENDVRLTANIRRDLHTRLKIKAAKERTTIGELIEQLVEKHVEDFI